MKAGSEAVGSARGGWAFQVPPGPPARQVLAWLVDRDRGRDDAENDYFESANDPQAVLQDDQQRRFRAQFRRRIRHRAAKRREAAQLDLRADTAVE